MRGIGLQSVVYLPFSLGSGPLRRTDWIRLVIAAAQRTRKEPVLTADGNRPDLVLDPLLRRYVKVIG